jgi:hypothetical protein
LALTINAAEASTTTTLTFDELAPGTSLAAGYGGFNWTETYNSCCSYPDFQPGIVADSTNDIGSGHAAVSGQNYVYNGNNGDPVHITWANPGYFDFTGAFWTAGWSEMSMSLQFEGYKDGVLKYSSAQYDLSDAVATEINLNWTEINDLVVNRLYSPPEWGIYGGYWAMDNFNYAPSAVSSPVPLPASASLFGIGLAAVFGRRRLTGTH